MFLTDIYECQEKGICLNNGTCVDTSGSYYCLCENGWTGDNCEIGNVFFHFQLEGVWVWQVLVLGENVGTFIPGHCLKESIPFHFASENCLIRKWFQILIPSLGHVMSENDFKYLSHLWDMLCQLLAKICSKSTCWSFRELNLPRNQEVAGSFPARSATSFCGDWSHNIFTVIFTVIFSLPLIQERQLSVSGERMCTILVNPLED